MQQIHERKPLYVGVDTVAYDFGVSRAKAYAIIKDLNMELKKENPNVENNIFQSIHNVQLDTMAGYKQAGTEHSFLEKFGINGGRKEK